MPDGIHEKKELNIIINMEKRLPELKEKAIAKANIKTELDTFEQILPELKRKFVDVENTYDEFKKEFDQENIKFVKLQLQLEPLYVRAYNRIIQSWKYSKTLFSIKAILIAMLITLIVAAFYKNNTLQTLTVESGFALIVMIMGIKFPKYWPLTGMIVFAILLFIYVNFSDESIKWTLISIGIAVAGTGLALQAFSSGIEIEGRIRKIDENVKKLLDSKRQ